MDAIKLYSDHSAQRVRQIVADLIALIVVILSIVAGVTTHAVISGFGSALASLENAGEGFEQTMIDIGENLGNVPFIGDGIRGPFDAASGAGTSIAAAGRTGQAIVENIAVFAGFGVALLPIAILLLVWLWPRLRFVRRAAETRALLSLDDGESLLALRALGTARAADLARISPRPVLDWQTGEPSVTRRLAAVAARSAGVRIAGSDPAQRA